MKGILAAGLICVAAALAACGGDNSNNGPQACAGFRAGAISLDVQPVPLGQSKE